MSGRKRFNKILQTVSGKFYKLFLSILPTTFYKPFSTFFQATFCNFTSYFLQFYKLLLTNFQAVFVHLYNPFYSYFACRLCVDSNCRPLAKKTTSLPLSPNHWLAPFTKQEVGPFHKNVFKIYNFFIESVRVGGRCSIFWYSCVNWVERNSGQQMASNQRRPPMFKTKKSQ